jgi:MoxR-like ATPase
MGLYRCAQALSAIRGREYVTPDEIKILAPFTLSHRVILHSQARLRERTPDSIIGEILNQIEVPV